MPFETLSAGLLAWLLLVIFFAGVVQGALGFGFPFVATPLIAMMTLFYLNLDRLGRAEWPLVLLAQYAWSLLA